MALIKDSKPKKVSGGYVRIFGNEELGNLISRVQSAVTSSGNELETLIKSRTKKIENLDDFVKQDIIPDGVFVAHKRDVKKSKSFLFSRAEPDFIVFKRKEGKQQCYLIELKDGDTFDTKKASSEWQAMHDFRSKNGPRLPFVVTIHFCCFNQNNREEIVKGFKNKIDIEEAMTGREFCELLELDYESIVEQRSKAVGSNLPYFLSELIKIEAVKSWLTKNFG